MIKVNIDYKNLSVETIGHSNDILCARVSTIIQYTAMLFTDTLIIKSKEIKYGYSCLEFAEIGESLFLTLVKALKDLEEMYPSNLTIKEINNG